MYSNFFGFSEKPFELTPDPKFLFLTPSHREALASLVYGIHERRGFMALVGEVGTGKTTLLSTVLRELEKEIEIRVGFIFNPSVTFHGMLTMALVDLGLAKPNENLSKAKVLHRLNEFAIRQLSRGGNVVLLVDEAQNLDRSAMENLRLLSNMETYRNKLIQVVLSGQPELDVKLHDPKLRQLSERISLKRYITSLSEAETYDYIQHRLRVAEYSGPTLFDLQTQQLIWEYSGGVPRRINILCDNALLVGFALRKKTVDRTVIEEAIKDLTWSPFISPKETQATTPVQLPPPVPKTIEPSVIKDAIKDLSGSPSSGSVETQATTSVQPPPQLREKTSYSRFTRVALLGLAACIILGGFFLGFLLAGRSQPNPDLEGSRPIPLSVAPAEIENQEPSPSETGESPTRETPVVTVKKGDNLSWIIVDAYGRYDMGLVRAVLRENPQIQDPDWIMVDQVIKLPEEK